MAKRISPLRPCPICRQEAHADYKPFCSRRCADVDLSRWLGGAYALPALEEDDPDEGELRLDS